MLKKKKFVHISFRLTQAITLALHACASLEQILKIITLLDIAFPTTSTHTQNHKNMFTWQRKYWICLGWTIIRLYHDSRAKNIVIAF